MLQRVGAPSPSRALLIDQLCEAGLAGSVAEDLVEKFSASIIERQLRALPYRKLRNIATGLQSAIRNNWALPAEMVRAKMSSQAPGGQNEQWQGVDLLQPQIDAALAARPDGDLLAAHAAEVARVYFPNQLGNDGRDMENMPRAVRMVLAFELGFYDELKTPFATYGTAKRRFGPWVDRSGELASGRGATLPDARPVAGEQEAMLL